MKNHIDLSSTPTLIIIVGPTAAGKSDFAVSLAERVNGVILNGDMAQMYTPLTIGTAKPDWRNEKVSHELFDSIDEPRDSSACEFRKKTIKSVQDVFARGKIPIVVGGSLFHIATLFFQLHDSESGLPDSPVLKMAGSSDNGVCNLWQQLYDIDPQRASQIARGDSYRLARALELSRKQLPSECMPTFRPIHNPCIIIHVTRDREVLYDRINTRVVSMLDSGWVQEVEGLSDAWRTWLLRKKIIGYNTIIQELMLPRTRHATSLSAGGIAMIQQKTRNYAKRQLTFWRSFKRRLNNESFHNIIECDLTLLPIDLYLEKILNLLIPKRQ